MAVETRVCIPQPSHAQRLEHDPCNRPKMGADVSELQREAGEVKIGRPSQSAHTCIPMLTRIAALDRRSPTPGHNRKKDLSKAAPASPCDGSVGDASFDRSSPGAMRAGQQPLADAAMLSRPEPTPPWVSTVPTPPTSTSRRSGTSIACQCSRGSTVTRLGELLRFADPAEGAASLALREGRTEALGFYLDSGRVHVGDLATMTEDVFTAWQGDRGRGLDSIMLAPTRELASELNQRARAHRLSEDPGPAGATVGPAQCQVPGLIETSEPGRTTTDGDFKEVPG